MNLFSDFVAEGNSGFRSINTRRNACRQKLPLVNFRAHVQFSCHQLSSNSPSVVPMSRNRSRWLQVHDSFRKVEGHNVSRQEVKPNAVEVDRRIICQLQALRKQFNIRLEEAAEHAVRATNFASDRHNRSIGPTLKQLRCKPTILVAASVDEGP